MQAQGKTFASTLSDAELHLISEGNELRLSEKLGAQLRELDGIQGATFAVWAPNAKRVSVVGDFNNWDGRQNEMHCLGDSGVWEVFVPWVEKEREIEELTLKEPATEVVKKLLAREALTKKNAESLAKEIIRLRFLYCVFKASRLLL